MSTIVGIIQHYQRSIEKCPGDEGRLLHCIQKLCKIPVTVDHLQETGIGKTVNALRKYDGEVGVAAKALVTKWKNMVAAEEDVAVSSAPTVDKSKGLDHSQSYNNDISGSSLSKSRSGDKLNGYKDNSSMKQRESEEINNYHSSRKKEKYDKLDKRKHENPKSDEKSKDSYDKKKSNDSHGNGLNDSFEKFNGNPSHDFAFEAMDFENAYSQYEDDEDEDEEKLIIDDHKEKDESDKKSQKLDKTDSKKSSNDSHHSRKSDNREKDSSKSSRRDEKSSKSLSEKDRKKDDKERHHKEKHHEKSERNSDRSDKSDKRGKDRSEKSDRRDRDRSAERSERRDRDRSAEKSERRDRDRSSEKSERRDRDRSSEKSERRDRDRSTEKSSKERSEKSDRDDKKDKRDRHEKREEKEKDKKHEKKDKSERTDKERTEKSSSKHKEDKSERTSSKDEPRKSEGSSHRSSSKSKDSKEKESKNDKRNSKELSSEGEEPAPKKQKKAVVEVMEEGIDCSMGKSFEEALGMIVPSTSSKSLSKTKSTKVNGQLNKSSSSSSDQAGSSSGSSSSSLFAVPAPPRSKTPPLLTAKAKLEPLDPAIALELPTISNNYKPLPLNPTVMDCVFSSNKPQRRQMTDEEALAAGISSKTIRTKVYSGSRTGVLLQAPSLFDLCIRVLQKNIDALEYTGGVPFEVLKPVLERATPQQLLIFEDYNPYLMEDSDSLWQQHINRHYRAKKRLENESWREMFIRCKEEQDERLSMLTENIKLSQKKVQLPVKKTQLAYVDSAVKPPRSVMRKQEIYGTKSKVVATPAARVAALSNVTANIAKIGDSRLKSAPGARDTAQASTSARPRKAPLMQKTLQFMKGRFKRK